jgi:menaquinone-dependent protoporphyrinogen oxidase
MVESVLVTYASRYGSTREVAEAIAATLREEGLEIAVQPMEAVRSLEPYRAVVMGAALYMFRWHKSARRFLARHQRSLGERPVAVFALGPVKDPLDDKEWQASRAQLDKELARYGWFEPIGFRLFGGKLDPALLRFPLDRLAGKEPATDIRDWSAIREWARTLATLLRPAAGGAPVDGRGAAVAGPKA